MKAKAGKPSRTCPRRTWLRDQMREAFARWRHLQEHGKVPADSQPAFVMGWLQSVAMFTDAERADLERTDGGS